ncbi:(2E,6E)-farnesyl diphosphate synthase [Idiomarina xiamenensis]|uniref:Geranylgeranyl pyrophosphate synthase n=1 Tax=Idiomarina xiamenensis 10-D-4 TaxID=740709 RepID=K2LCI6_9GAMM|nr:(2E,6E)-farnesyl diphosphate synthase [Idiomarina xiamenensis]EKE87595.1 geranylgeranyl pyrophosphate synthase [Idiomarina xiamenensis 10-D-4]
MTLKQLLEPSKTRVNQFLQQQLSDYPHLSSNLAAAMQHGLLLGGKRVRPHLLFSIGELCQANAATLNWLAAAVESVHAYSLIHDDLPAMDDDELRRGQPTCHIAFDEATAILAGDALQTLAFEWVSQPLPEVSAQRQLKIVQQLALASGAQGMCGGQALDIEATRQQLSEQQLAQIHQHKTGALIQAAANMAVLAGNDEAQQYLPAFSRFAADLGLAFQVQDDILDEIGQTEALGKPQGSDSAAEKATYVRLLGLQGAQQRRQQLHESALHALSTIPYNTTSLAQLANVLLNRDH